jgi:hypothetical protein
MGAALFQRRALYTTLKKKWITNSFGKSIVFRYDFIIIQAVCLGIVTNRILTFHLRFNS